MRASSSTCPSSTSKVTTVIAWRSLGTAPFVVRNPAGKNRGTRVPEMLQDQTTPVPDAHVAQLRTLLFPQSRPSSAMLQMRQWPGSHLAPLRVHPADVFIALGIAIRRRRCGGGMSLGRVRHTVACVHRGHDDGRRVLRSWKRLWRLAAWSCPCFSGSLGLPITGKSGESCQPRWSELAPALIGDRCACAGPGMSLAIAVETLVAIA